MFGKAASTKPVPEAGLGVGLGPIRSAEQVCNPLVDLALERGGSDNIPVLVGRAPPR